MISLDKFKKALGNEKEKMSEEDILKLRENQDKMAEIFFSMWLKESKKVKS